MIKKVLFTIAYDGTDFFGWQIQKDPSVRTVQGELEIALSRLFKTEIKVTLQINTVVIDCANNCRIVSTSFVKVDMISPLSCVSKYLIGKSCMCSNKRHLNSCIYFCA